MLAAMERTLGTSVIAQEVSKDDGPFECPSCKNEVIVRKGLVKVHHFSHKPPYEKTCKHKRGEREEHRRVKMEIYNALKANSSVLKVFLEKKIGATTPDVAFRTANGTFAVEVLASTFNEAELAQITTAYQEFDVGVVWVLPARPELTSHRMSVRTYERWLHAAYRGRLYYHAGGDSVRPVHLDPAFSWVDQTEYGGGYWKTLKLFKDPNLAKPQSLAIDFRQQAFPAWREGKFNLPATKLALGGEGKFWEDYAVLVKRKTMVRPF